MRRLAVLAVFLFVAACRTAATPAPVPSLVPTPAPTATVTPLTVVVEIDHLYLKSAVFGGSRLVDVYLPPGYAQSDARYPVLYANDGQDMEVIRLRTILQDLYARDAVAPFIFVAVHTSGYRIEEYGLAGQPAVEGIGSRADLYTAFLLNEVKPHVEANYRILSGPENTAIMGWSLGGLSAFDLAWNHPDVFGAAGCFSGSFWVYDNESAPAASRLAHRMVVEGNTPPGLRFWFQTGFLEEQSDRDSNGVIDVVQDARELVELLQTKGYSDIALIELPEGGHDKLTWAQVLPEFLNWAFPPE